MTYNEGFAMAWLRFFWTQLCSHARVGGLACLSMVLVAGCSLTPSDQDISRALMGNDPLNNRVYQMRNIQRINGYERPDGYVIEYSAELHIIENPMAYFQHLSSTDQSGLGALAALGMATQGLARWGLITSAVLSSAQPGQVVPVNGSLLMIKSEQGWIPKPE
jgi:hypothetical protein